VSKSTRVQGAAGHEALAVVLQVRDGRLEALLWKRAKPPFENAWALPGGMLGDDETLEESIRRHLATKVDVRRLSHLEQLETLSDPERHPVPADTGWHAVDELPGLAFDHLAIVLAGRERLRAKLSYTNIGFALAPPTFTIAELRGLYRAALGHDLSATNLQRILLRRALLEPTGEQRPPGRAGGRPASVYRFRNPELEVTDQFAVLRPPS